MRTSQRPGVLSGALIAGVKAQGADGRHPPHDKAFWLGIARDDYKVPAGDRPTPSSSS